MKTIPVRHIATAPKEQNKAGRFNIRSVQQILNGKNLVHDLHKHDFFFVLALHKGAGMHEIDFIPYNVHDHSVFIIRPGQVHRLELKTGSTGFPMEFDQAFYLPKHTITDQRWKKASFKNYCEVEAGRFMKLHSFVKNVFNEFTTKEDGYPEAIKANLDLFFIEYTRQSHNPKSITKAELSHQHSLL